jgi:acetolactate synthase I/III small subunit
MRHVISAQVENRFGVLAHIAGLFAARGYNIESLAVGPTHDPSISRMTIVVTGSDRVLEQVNKQLNKLVDVIRVQDLTVEEHVELELVLLRVKSNPKIRGEIAQIAELFDARIVDVRPGAITIMIADTQDRIAALTEMVRPYGIHELVRSGSLALART